ncbi:tetratricopeptide repeat protein, partial [bacterium]|nr:tetratricopeptide repeat protein [bacterium]
MKKYILPTIIFILAACSPKEDNDVKSTSQDIKQKPASTSVSEKIKIPASEKSSVQIPEFVSLNGKWTNIVDNVEHDKFFREDKRSLDELILATETSPDNPDAWFALGKKYWNGYNEVSNAAACYEKAIALHPDSISLRVNYAEISATQLDIAGAKKAFSEAYKYAKTDKEKSFWANNVNFYADMYRNKGLDTSWTVDILKENAADNPHANKNLARIYSRLGQKDKAKECVMKGMNSTTNTELQIMLVQEFARLRYNADDKKVFQAEYDELLNKSSISPFKKIILKTQVLDYNERMDKLPALCAEALDISTNLEQRYEALAPLASLYSRNANIDKFKETIEKVLDGEKPTTKISERIFRLMKSAGDTNGAAELLTSTISSETNEEKVISLSLSIATLGKDINEEMINELVDRFPSNGNMYAKLADIFKQNEWYDKEILYRKKALEFLTRDYEKNAQAAELIKRYLKFDELDNAEKILTEYANVLSNNASYTISMSKVYFAKGRTNDAFELLMTNCGKMAREADKEQIIKKLLIFNWPEKNQHSRAANAAEELVGKMSLDIRHARRESIYKLLIKSYVFLGEPDKALAICKKLFSQGGRVNQFPTVCNLINDPEKIEAFITEMLSSGSSQTYFYTSAAAACEKAMLPELALQLFVKAWKSQSESWNRSRHAASAIRLANELKNYTVRDEILKDIIEKYKSGEMEYWSLWSISRVMRNMNLNEKYEEMLTMLIENSKGRKRSSAISSLIENYSRNNNKQGIRNLVSTYYEGKELDVDDSFALARIYQTLGEHNKLKPIMNKVELQLTNSSLISRHGSSLLWSMSSFGEKEKATALAKKWFNDPNIDQNCKRNLLYMLMWSGDKKEAITLAENFRSKMPEGYQKQDITRQLMRMYSDDGNVSKFKELSENIINDPKASSGNLEEIANSYKGMNLDAEALMIYGRILDKLDENSSRRFDVLNRQAELYIKMGDAKSAIECAIQSAAARPEDPGINSLLANAYRADGQSQKALEEYCKGIKKSGNAHWQRVCCNQLAELVQTTDIDFDASLLANTLLEKNRTVQSLMTAANLYSVSDDINASERLINEALGQTTIDSQKAKVYSQWLGMVRKNGDEKLLDKTMRDYFNVASDSTKGNLARQISDLAIKSGDYEKTITDSKAMLAEIDSSPNSRWYTSQIQKNIARAYMEMGDTENAWKTIKGSTESSKDNIYGSADWNTFMNYARELGKTDEAAEVLEEAFKNSIPRNKNQMIVQLLNAYKDSGRDEDIEKLITESDKMLKNSSSYEKQRFVDFYKEAGETDKAMDILKELSTDGNKWSKRGAVTKLYKMYKDNNQLDEALEWAKEQPKGTEVNGMIAEIYREQGDFDKATELYQKIVESPGIDQYNKQNYINQLIKSASKTDDKEKIVNKIIKNIKKENAGSVKNQLNQSIGIYQNAEMYDEAISKIKKATSLTKNKKEIKNLNNQHADCLAKSGEYDDAVNVYEKILKNDDSMKWEEQIAYHNKIAKTYKDAHRSDEAKETAEDIVKSCKEFLREHEYGNRAMNARFALAEAYENSGDKEEARDTLEKIQKKYKHTSHAKRA